VLQEQFSVILQPEELLTAFSGDGEEGTVLNIGGLCQEIQQHLAEARGFEINLKVILGNFAFQKMAMVKDLQKRWAVHPHKNPSGPHETRIVPDRWSLEPRFHRAAGLETLI